MPARLEDDPDFEGDSAGKAWVPHCLSPRKALFQAVLLHFMEHLAMCLSELEALRERQGL